jgi:hypothetical protein
MATSGCLQTRQGRRQPLPCVTASQRVAMTGFREAIQTREADRVLVVYEGMRAVSRAQSSAGFLGLCGLAPTGFCEVAGLMLRGRPAAADEISGSGSGLK